jgi:hypothetical protein
MSLSKKKPIIDLPVKVFFSEIGVSFFIENNKKMNKFTMADKTEQYGILMKQFSPPSVQHMLRVGYVSRVEVSRPEFTSKRSEIMDLSKLIVYGILYKLFEEEVFDSIMDSGIINDWNRSNPGNSITRETKINEKILGEILEKNKSFVAGVKKELTRAILNEIMRDQGMQADEKNIQIFLMEKFISTIRPLAWFVLVKFSNAPEYPEIIDSIRKKLSRYLRRSKIAEYLSLMIMELNISAETVNLKNYMDRKYKGTMPFETVMFDPQRREQIMVELEKENQLISLAWLIGIKKGNTIGTEKKLQVIVYNKGAEYLQLKEKVDEKMNTDIRNISLTDFYKNANTANADMGMYYLSYVVDECDKMNIKFSSRVNQTADGLSFITLTLTF